jgi:histidinol-phosphatase (PHP family)
MGIEYLILGQHWLENEIGAHGSAAPTADVLLLGGYCRQVCDAIETGKITYIAHPDLINFVGNPQSYRHYVRDMCREAKQSGTPLELNLLGLAYGKHYPNERFWEVAAEEGCQVILGLDAHAPAHILNQEAEARARNMVQQLGLELLDTVDLKQV